jgi:TonB-linked SusC/RagA family outer membrane protein
MRGKAFKSYFKIIILTIVTLCITTLTHNVQAQSDSLKLVKGVVTDENLIPVENATVRIAGTSRGASTNAKGEFSIRVANGDKLEISHIGMTEMSIIYSGQTSLNISLSSDVKKGVLDEVTVISTGYQNLDRKMFTGASDKLLAKDVERSGVPDLSRMLEGQSAGVSVQNVSGTFGAAPKIRIRGATSLNGDNKPLWVIDGIILEDVVNISNEALSTGDANTLIGSSVAGLNPNDIESITILKDAAATALYGARAMNGVIVVTTKKGTNTQGKPRVNYSGTFTTYLKPSYDNFDIMNSAEQMGILTEMENKGFLRPASVGAPQYGGIFYKLYNEMYQYDEFSDTWALGNDFSKEDKYKFLTRYANANTDWFDILFQNSLLQEHSVSVSSGSSNVQNYFSTSYMKDNGQTLGDNVSRFTANARSNFKVNQKLSFELLANAGVRNQRAPGTLSRQSDPVFGSYSRDFDINPYSYALNSSRLLTPYDENGNREYFIRNWAPFNILNELDKNYLELKMLDIKVQGGVRYKIIPGLQYSMDASYRYAQTTRQHFIEEGSNMAESFRAAYNTSVIENNRNLYDDPDNPYALPVVILDEGGFFNMNENKIASFYLRNNLEFDKSFGNHRINVFSSIEARSSDRQTSRFDGVGYQYENGGLVNPNYRYFKKMIEGGNSYFGMNYGKDRYAAAMLRGAYNFNDKYTINGTVRYDGSNKMGKSAQARWLPTWNVSGAWDISQEDFLVNSNFISSARLRATYGLVANIGNATNTIATFYNQIAYRPYETEKEALIYLNSLANSQLTWEKLYEFNIGTDLSFFNNRVNITADWYQRDIFDLLGVINTSGIGGENKKVANYGEMKSHGFELTLGGLPVVSGSSEGLQWRTQLNFGINKNKITKLEASPRIWSLVRAEGDALLGYPQRGLFSIKFEGLNPVDGSPMFINEDGKKDNYVYLQSFTPDHLKYEGPVDPLFTGGFFNKIDYKQFSISALFTFATGNFIRLQPSYGSRYDDMTAISQNLRNRWIMSGDEQFTNIPSILDLYSLDNYKRITTNTSQSASYPYNAYNYSTENVAKGDFIRLKTVSLSYNLPRNLTQRWGLDLVQLSVVGNNVALLYSDKKLMGADPEFFNNGGVAMPIPKQYTFALKVGL